MADNILNTRITLKRDTKSNWETQNPVLKLGEMGIEFDPNAVTNSYKVRAKVGDGTLAWSALPYLAGEDIVMPAPDNSSIVADDNTWSVHGFTEANAYAVPIKNNGVIEWDEGIFNNVTTLMNGAVRYDVSQELNATQKTTALTNIGAEPAFTKNTAFNVNFETNAEKIAMDGTASVGSLSTVARADHVHPTDNSRASVTDLSNHISNTSNPHSVTATQANAVSYAVNQSLNAAQKTIARTNIDAMDSATKYGASLDLSIDNTTYVVTAQLKDQDGTALGSAQTIDLPIESVVVDGRYLPDTKEVQLDLQSGANITFSVADLVSGLQTEITSENKLNSDLVDDTNHVNKFVNNAQIEKLAGIQNNAQVNVLEAVKLNNTALTINSADKSVNIEIAGANLGVVASSTATDNITVNSTTGVMTVASLSTDKLVQGSNVLVLDGGTATL